MGEVILNEILEFERGVELHLTVEVECKSVGEEGTLRAVVYKTVQAILLVVYNIVVYYLRKRKRAHIVKLEYVEVVFVKECTHTADILPFFSDLDVLVNVREELVFVSLVGRIGNVGNVLSCREGVVTRDGSYEKRESLGILYRLCLRGPGGVNVADEYDSCGKSCLRESLVKLVHKNDVPIGRSFLLALVAFAVVVPAVSEPDVEIINVGVEL